MGIWGENDRLLPVFDYPRDVEQGAVGYVGGGGAVLCFALYVIAHPAEVVHV